MQINAKLPQEVKNKKKKKQKKSSFQPQQQKKIRPWLSKPYENIK